jgi:putative phage-type endonuclease
MIEQGTPEWHAMRCGKVTASRVADVMRSGRGGAPSASRARYMGELVAERLTGVPYESFKSAEMQRGNEIEAEAVSAYAFICGAQCDRIAFVDHPSIEMAGASPDALIGDDGLAEFKCPASHTHIQTLLSDKIDGDYVRQMQWQMACTGRQWCDFVSYDPRLPTEMALYVRRLQRDDAAIAAMEMAVSQFLFETSMMVDDLKAKYANEVAA